MHGLIQDVEDGYVKRVAFVVPSHASWSLPIYELALTMAERAFDMCADVELTLLTPEPSPLAVFGPSVSRDVGQMLARAGISVRSGVNVEMPFGNVLELHPTGGRLNVDRVVTVPIVTGPAIEGLPHDAAGFLPVDDYGRVLGVSGVYAAGDATNFSVKQGGIACQQADAAAEAIAADAGVAIRPTRFAPVLRGVLVTEHDTRWLGYDDAGQPLPDPRRAKLSGGSSRGFSWTRRRTGHETRSGSCADRRRRRRRDRDVAGSARARGRSRRHHALDPGGQVRQSVDGDRRTIQRPRSVSAPARGHSPRARRAMAPRGLAARRAGASCRRHGTRGGAALRPPRPRARRTAGDRLAIGERADLSRRRRRVRLPAPAATAPHGSSHTLGVRQAGGSVLATAAVRARPRDGGRV